MNDLFFVIFFLMIDWQDKSILSIIITMVRKR